MRICGKRLILIIAAALLFLAAQRHSLAGSATWSTNPASAEWNTAANWMPNTVPNGPSDVATFDTSNMTNLSINTTSVEVDSIIFNGGAPAFTITADAQNGGISLDITGAGLLNNSGVVQS